MKLSEVPGSLILEFESGYIPMDEPPGLEEHAYRAWKESGGRPNEIPLIAFEEVKDETK